MASYLQLSKKKWYRKNIEIIDKVKCLRWFLNIGSNNMALIFRMLAYYYEMARWVDDEKAFTFIYKRNNDRKKRK